MGCHRRNMHDNYTICNATIYYQTVELHASPHTCLFVCFVCLGFIVPLENFSVIWRRSQYRWRAANFDLCSALIAIEQWGFFRAPRLLWHGVPFYNGHLRGLVTQLLANVKRWSCYYLFLRRFVAVGIRIPQLPLASPTLLPTAPTPPSPHTYVSISYLVVLGNYKKGNRSGGVKIDRSPRMREIGIRSPVATDVSRKNR